MKRRKTKLAQCPICKGNTTIHAAAYTHSLSAVCSRCRFEFYPRRKTNIPLAPVVEVAA